MSRLQLIENALIEINETLFQELCDSYLAIRNENYSAYARTGSMSGKQKTIKGTPDTFLLLPNGKYMFVEYSTNISAKVSKLEDDLKKCIDSKKTGIPKSQILEIIICINFNLNTAEVERLRKVLISTRIRLSVVSLDSLSIELHLHHRDLAHQYLGLALDTGQIVSIEQFVKEYNRASNQIATPLDNMFVQREAELAELKSALLFHDFIILTGPPGIGKTKLVIETIEDFLSENTDFNAYCISYKNYALLDDLFQYLDVDKNYILLVDDANRIDAFGQITGFYRALRSGKLKIIITVRDYAYQEIGRLCQEFEPRRIDLGKLTDAAIIEIISSEPFNIKNSKYHANIVNIADGNPRLAIMASMIANAHQSIAVLHDVADLFERYFSAFLRDKEELSSDFTLKCLGIIGFFFALPYKDRDLVVPVLENFGMDYGLFLDTIDRLDKLELIEIQFDHVKVPEQNLSIYFFYKCFIKEDLLSFTVLLHRYFESNKSRFRECIISANNTFGPKKVMDKLKPDLVSYWNSISNDDEKAYSFLKMFWFYLREETFSFLYKEIEKLSLKDNGVYKVDYGNNAFSHNKDAVIELLGEYFKTTEALKDAIALSFKYIEKRPEQLPELIHKIREQLLFDWRDREYGFFRQHTLWDFLIGKISENTVLYALVSLELAKTFLKYKFQHTESGRNHSFSIYTYPIPNNEEIQSLRVKIWNNLGEIFYLNEEKALDTLESYAAINPDVEKEIMAFDLPYLVAIIDRYLDKGKFEHCLYVNSQIRWCRRMGLQSKDFFRLEKYFANRIYFIFLKIDWDRLRDKEMYEFSDYKEYEKLKEAEIRNSFRFESIAEIQSFYADFSYLKNVAKKQWSYNSSLEFIVDENFKHDLRIGLGLLEVIISHDNEIGYIPRLALLGQLNDDDKITAIWQLIDTNDFKNKREWKLSFFDYVAEKKVSEDLASQLIFTIESLDTGLMLQLDRFDKFLRIDPTLFQKILDIIFNKNEAGIEITVWGDFFSTHFDYLGGNLGMIKKSYLQQFKMQNYFDHDLLAFEKILRLDINFLKEFILSQYSNREFGNIDEHRSFKMVWDIPGIEATLLGIFELFVEKSDYYAILPSYLNVFFRNLDEVQGKRADEFLINYVHRYYSDPNHINHVVDIARHERRELFEKVLLTYVSLNTKLEHFRKIWWRGNGGSYVGDVIMGDSEAADWRNILSIIEKSDAGIELIPIKKYLLDEESTSLRSGDLERKRRFLDRW